MKHLFVVLTCLLFESCLMAQEKKLNGPAEFIKIIQQKADSLGLNEFGKQKAVTTWQIILGAAENSGRQIPLWNKFNPKETALVVVDMQNGFIQKQVAPIEIAKGRDIVDNVNALARTTRSHGGKVVWVQYSVKDDGGFLAPFESKSYIDPSRESPLIAFLPGHPLFEIYPKLEVRRGDLFVHKNRYCASFSTLKPSLNQTLKKHRVKNVIVAGVSTDVCAGGTAEGLAQTGFNVVVSWDGTAALDRLIGHEGYLAKLWLLYCEVMTTKQIINQLLK